jgi:hypothetical protein
VGAAAGGWVAFVPGVAASLERKQQLNHELRTAAVGDFTPPDKWITARGYRVGATGIFLCGVVLILAGVLEMLPATGR